MAGYLIKDTTKEERERIVAESIGNINGACDGCAAGLADMYQDYIDGKRELREINMSFAARYVFGSNGPAENGCGYARRKRTSEIKNFRKPAEGFCIWRSGRRVGFREQTDQVKDSLLYQIEEDILHSHRCRIITMNGNPHKGSPAFHEEQYLMASSILVNNLWFGYNYKYQGMIAGASQKDS
jgi:hypothetical protein